VTSKHINIYIVVAAVPRVYIIFGILGCLPLCDVRPPNHFDPVLSLKELTNTSSPYTSLYDKSRNTSK